MAETGQRMLAAIVFTDAVEYAARVGRDEEATVAAVRADLDLMRLECERFGGQVVKNMGDGLMMVFTSAVQAVSCALSIQQLIPERAALAGTTDPLLHRIGIHLGDVLLGDGDVHGDGVNVAARLQERADPGGICLSQTVVDVVKSRVFLETQRIGELQLKHVTEPVVAYRIAGVAAARRQPPHQRSVAAVYAGVALLLIGLTAAATIVISRNIQSSEPQARLKETDARIDRRLAELERVANEINEKAKAQTEDPTGTPPLAKPPQEPHVSAPDPATQKTTAKPNDDPKPVVPLADSDEFKKIRSEYLPHYDFAAISSWLKPRGPEGVALARRYDELDELLGWIRESLAKTDRDHPLSVKALGADSAIIAGDDNGFTVLRGDKETKMNLNELNHVQLFGLIQSIAFDAHGDSRRKVKLLERLGTLAEELEVLPRGRTPGGSSGEEN